MNVKLYQEISQTLDLIDQLNLQQYLKKRNQQPFLFVRIKHRVHPLEKPLLIDLLHQKGRETFAIQLIFKI